MEGIQFAPESLQAWVVIHVRNCVRDLLKMYQNTVDTCHNNAKPEPSPLIQAKKQGKEPTGLGQTPSLLLDVTLEQNKNSIGFSAEICMYHFVYSKEELKQ